MMNSLLKGYKQADACIIPGDGEVDPFGEKTLKTGSGITPTGGDKVYNLNYPQIH